METTYLNDDMSTGADDFFEQSKVLEELLKQSQFEACKAWKREGKRSPFIL